MAGARLCPLVPVLMQVLVQVLVLVPVLVQVLVLVPVQAQGLVQLLALVLAGGTSSQEMPWWNDSAMSECLFTPNVTSAERMECDFSGVPFAKVTFRGGQIPSTVRAIWLSNAMQITISPDTFSHLEDLQLINITSVRTLEISRNNWTRVEHPQNVSISIEHVSQVIFDSQAFSGWSEPGPEIAVRNITRLYVEAFAFDSGSVIRKITIENVGRLWLKRGSFHASTEELNLHNVLLPEGCPRGSFGGDIGSLSLVSVQMRAVHSGCIQTSDAGWSRLEVRSSSLGDIEHLGISGNISDVVLDDTHIGRVRAGGLRVDVASFHMSGCAVKELAPRALDVRFTRSALLQTSRVTLLREGAFERVRPHAGDAPGPVFRRLSVATADGGSLAFSRSTLPSLLDVLLESCDCEPEQRAGQLVFGDEPPDNRSSHQRALEDLIISQVRCLVEERTPTLDEFSCQSCPSSNTSAARCDLTALAERAAGSELNMRLLIAAPSSLLLLLILLGVLLVLLKRRRSRRRAGRQLDDVHISNCSRQPAEALYAQIADITQRHSPSTTPSAMERRCKHYWRRQRADRPELPLPREADPVYVEMAPRPTVAPRATAGSRAHDVNSRHPHDGRRRVYENLHLVGRRTPLASVSPFVTPENLHLVGRRTPLASVSPFVTPVVPSSQS